MRHPPPATSPGPGGTPAAFTEDATRTYPRDLPLSGVWLGVFTVRDGLIANVRVARTLFAGR
ncbi:hypothetical protein GCM10010440_15400 [Kitasatospora cinereorecta]